MPDIIIDTHIVVWIFSETKRLSRNALTALQRSGADGTIFVSVISVVELIYLTERERISKDIIGLLYENVIDVKLPFQLVALSSDIANKLSEIPRNQIPEMPDRIISATAKFLELPLVTSDSKIRASSAAETIW